MTMPLLAATHLSKTYGTGDTAVRAVVEVPVVHRPRRFGESKFGIRGRAVRGFHDLLVVRWMQSRALRYSVDPDA